MGKDISLRMMELALCDAFHCRDLGKDGLQQVVPVQQLQAFRGVGTAENLGELVSNSFGADDLDFGGSFSYGLAGGLLAIARQGGGQSGGAGGGAAWPVASSISKDRLAAKRMARSMRSLSSVKRSPGSPMERIERRSMSFRPSTQSRSVWSSGS